MPFRNTFPYETTFAHVFRFGPSRSLRTQKYLLMWSLLGLWWSRSSRYGLINCVTWPESIYGSRELLCKLKWVCFARKNLTTNTFRMSLSNSMDMANRISTKLFVAWKKHNPWYSYRPSYRPVARGPWPPTSSAKFRKFCQNDFF